MEIETETEKGERDRQRREKERQRRMGNRQRDEKGAEGGGRRGTEAGTDSCAEHLLIIVVSLRCGGLPDDSRWGKAGTCSLVSTGVKQLYRTEVILSLGHESLLIQGPLWVFADE